MFVSKMPALAELPRTTPVLEEGKTSFVAKLPGGAKILSLVKNFSFELFLQKILSRFRVLVLKIENRTAGWLEALRKKSRENGKHKTDDHYWDELGHKSE